MNNFEKRRIFGEIDEIIKRNISNKPVPLNRSKFIEEYNKLKEVELNETDS